MNVHFKNGSGVKSFIHKCMQASDYKNVGDNAFRRKYVQRGILSSTLDGGQNLDTETLRVLKMTLLMCKLGCNRLANTYKFEKGGMSSRQARRHLANGTIPNFKIRMSSCLDHQGLKAICHNIDDSVSSGIVNQ